MVNIQRKWNLWFMLSVVLALMTTFQSKAIALDESAELLQKIPVTGTLSDGSTFQGRATITELSLNEAGQLVAKGVLRGKAGGKTVKQNFSNIVTQFSKTAPNKVNVAQTGPVCDILFLDIGAISLDLLGLTVDLSPVQLDINAVAGQGNLLGNLLCAVVSLLDGFNLDALLLGIINNILAAINEILGA